VRIFGVDLPREAPPEGVAPYTFTLLDEQGRAGEIGHASTLPEVAVRVGELCRDEPFLLATNVPVVVPAKPARARPVENLLRRRLGFRLPPGGRATLSNEPHGVVGETLVAGLAAAGQPSLPFPDRDRRKPGLLESYPELILKALLWISSPMSTWTDRGDLAELFRACRPAAYRASRLPARTGWAEQAVVLEQTLRSLGTADGFDLAPVLEALSRASSSAETEQAAAMLDSLILAGMARRYLEAPESCLFVGDQERGYVVLPADSFIRRLGSEARPAHGRLFPKASLRQRLGSGVKVRSVDLLDLPGRPPRLEATFPEPPRYDFDNVDEMLWWKHTRHVGGPKVPTEGLSELVVAVGAEHDPETLRLVRSRHRTLSFRFEPPASWRSHVPTRDGRTYSFRVIRAVFETLPASS